ncbi:MAG: hypothetical protein DI589_18790 [Shinella sp.]|nr:MAG: hypothetical protein DI589_18790 [Shinella sp.]
MTNQDEFKELDYSKAINTNDLYCQFNGTQGYTKYSAFLLTDGVYEIATSLKSFWLLDMIISHQLRLNNEDFQVWKLSREMEATEDGEVTERTNVFILSCEDGNRNVLKKQKIPFSDFPFDTYTIWLQSRILFLPSEY